MTRRLNVPAALALVTAGAIGSAVAAARIERLTVIRNAYPVLSPDGRTVMFISNRSASARMAPTSASTRAAGRCAPTRPTRPTGRGSPTDLAAPDGSGIRQVTEGPWSHVQASWAPDGRSVLAFANVERPEHEFGDVVRVWLEEPPAASR